MDFYTLNMVFWKEIWGFYLHFKRMYFMVLTIDLDPDLEINYIFGLGRLWVIEFWYRFRSSSMRARVDFCRHFRNSSNNEALSIGIAPMVFFDFLV